MAHHLLQANINHCAAAQDLLVQSMAQWLIEVAVAAEPYFVPPSEDWLGDTDGSVAIVLSRAAGPPPLSLVVRGRGYVAARWRKCLLIGVYFSPNRTLAEFEAFLGGLGALIGQNPSRPVLVMGDLNAKSMAWGSPATDARGEVLLEWVTVTGLTILNRGSVNTCVRRQGGSIVDISFASPAVARTVRGWRVLEEVETLSDHRYIRFDVSTSPEAPGARHPERCTSRSPRWVLGSLDREVLEEAALVQAWSAPAELAEVEDEVLWFRDAMANICDAAMSRAKPRPPKRQVYWWSSEIAALRASCVEARRQYTRHRRRRRRDAEMDGQLYEVYKTRTKALQLSISQAKARARADLLDSLEADPWGRPYKWVRGKIRPWAPPLTETMEPRLLEDVVSALFPHRAEHSPPDMGSAVQDQGGDHVAGVPEVSEGELDAAVQRARRKNTAPGPDGIPGRVWALCIGALGDRLRRLLDACLESGRFPSWWKTGRLVLIKKDGRPAESPSAYRPIVMLDEAEKILERVIAGRLVEHLDEVGPGLSDNQFGFRAGRSTIDAILRVKARSEEVVARGGVVLAISLDIANAFNTLPWACIREALVYHNVPPYLCRIVGAYLSDRYISYPGRGGLEERREMSCGVPQGSVLGPLLWNIGYDWVLRGDLPPGAEVTCYADDTLVTAPGENFEMAARLATEAVALVVGRIEALGLKVALNKTEAVCFHGPRKAPPRGSRVTIGETHVEVRSEMKYLGLVLDSRWSFREHFARLGPRLIAAAAALRRLLPNIGGPGEGNRRLYLGVVRSMALYGCPVWAEILTADSVAHLRRAQRAIAVGVIRGYRTISAEAACVLAGSPPWDLDAGALASVFHWRRELRLHGQEPAPREIEARKLHARQLLLEEWEERLAEPSAGHRTVEAVRPVLSEWTDRRHGSLTFRMVQVLSDHGCFGKYLHKIAGREPTTECHHCGCAVDTAQHTLEECPAWVSQRQELGAAVGDDLSLPALVKAMVEDERSWQAALTFCEEVMSQKEAAERERESESLLQIRSRRAGRRRRAYQALLQPP